MTTRRNRIYIALATVILLLIGTIYCIIRPPLFVVAAVANIIGAGAGSPINEPMLPAVVAQRIATKTAKLGGNTPIYSNVAQDIAENWARAQTVNWVRDNQIAFCGKDVEQTVQFIESREIDEMLDGTRSLAKLANQLAQSASPQDKNVGEFLLASQKIDDANQAARASLPSCQALESHKSTCFTDAAALAEPAIDEALTAIITSALKSDNSEDGLNVYAAGLTLCAAHPTRRCSHLIAPAQ